MPVLRLLLTISNIQDKQVDINTIIHSGTHVRAKALIEVEIQRVELIYLQDVNSANNYISYSQVE